MEQNTGLKIGIVGAGVAGLSAAIALRRAGHSCEIFEKSTFKNETGAAVSIPPNGGRILKRWGFDSTVTQGVEIKQVRRPKGDTLEPMAPTIDFSDIPERYGNEWFFYHRADMHKQLRSMAEDPVHPGTPAIIRLGSAVTDINVETGTLTLAFGQIVQKDLVIIADGQHDRLTQRITGIHVPTQRSGQVAYRCLVPMKDVLADPVTAPLFESEAPGFYAPALPARGVMCVTYPCRNNEILNCLIVARQLKTTSASDKEVKTIEDWNFPATPEMLEDVLKGFHPSIRALMMKSPDIKMYTQMKRDPLPCLTKGKALCIGDAAHTMLLTHAQGVSSSIEDAAALEIILRGIPGTTSVDSHPSQLLKERLGVFEKLRLGRVSATQILTEPILPGPDFIANGKKAEARIRQHYAGPLPPMTAMPHSKEICAFFFAYDVSKEAEEMVAQCRGIRTLQATSEVKMMSASVQPVDDDETLDSASKQGMFAKILTGLGNVRRCLGRTLC